MIQASVTRTRHAILESPIPAGGFGRALTPMECQALHDEGGIRYRTTYAVVRQGNSACLGVLFTTGVRGWIATGIIVQMRPAKPIFA